MTARDDLLKSFVDAMQDAGWHMTADEDYAEAERLIVGYRDQLLAEAVAADCAHAFPTLRTAGQPDTYGPCHECGTPYRPLVFHCYNCLQIIPTGSRKCPMPRCQEREAALLAEWKAASPELFGGEGQP